MVTKNVPLMSIRQFVSSIVLFAALALPAKSQIGTVHQIYDGCGPLTNIVDMSNSRPTPGGVLVYEFVLPSVVLDLAVVNIGVGNPNYWWFQNQIGFCSLQANPDIVIPVDLFRPTDIYLPVPRDPNLRGLHLNTQMVTVWGSAIATFASNAFQIILW